MEKISAAAKVDQERLFGDGVDIFKNYYETLGIYIILSSIGVRASHDSDWSKAVSEYITTEELGELYDKIISPGNRVKLAESRNHRTPPELNDDDPDDIISYLISKSMSFTMTFTTLLFHLPRCLFFFNIWRLHFTSPFSF